MRMEILAFEVLPDLADQDFYIMHGSHLMGIIWLLVVILVSYASWETIIKLIETEKRKLTLYVVTGAFFLVNCVAMVFEFVLFRLLVEDFNNQFSNAAELFGLLMVFAHQMASFWIMKNVVRAMYMTETKRIPAE